MSYGPTHSTDCNFFAGSEGVCNCGAIEKWDKALKEIRLPELKFSCAQCGRYMDSPCEHWKAWMESQKKENTMQPHQQRVVAELKELTGKREKLGGFIGGNIFNALPKDEQSRLRRQFDIMIEYEGVLQERIDHFPA